jgi:ribosomal protein S18 acetylase RimI-like enzyme
VDIGAISVKRLPTEVFLGTISIMPDHQGRGLGTAVITDLIREAQARHHPVALQVLKVNRARRLYERLGFIVTGETETHYQMRTKPPGEMGNP